MGTSMNNPFYYMLTRARDWKDSSHPYIPAMALLDGAKLEPTTGNSVDKTSWKAPDGDSVESALSALYFFDPQRYML